jgi:hypothetical protein
MANKRVGHEVAGTAYDPDARGHELQRRDTEPATVRFRFTCEHTHTHKGLPFTKGDEIVIPAYEADWIEAMGSGHRIDTHMSKE